LKVAVVDGTVAVVVGTVAVVVGTVAVAGMMGSGTRSTLSCRTILCYN
jgi:hypothetical protein